MRPTGIELVLILTGSALFGVVVLLVFQTGRVLSKLEEVIGLLGILSSQTNQAAKREKRTIDLLEDLRAGRGEEGDLARTFSDAEEQKVAFYRLAERTDSPQSQTLARGLKKTALALYQQIVDRFPDSREARIAKERIAEFEKLKEGGSGGEG